LVEQSDVIVSGGITVDSEGRLGSLTTTDGRNVSARTVTAKIVVDQLLKGSTATPDVTFEIVIPSVAIGYRTLASGSTRVVFLKRRGGSLVLTNPYHPSLPTIYGATLRSPEPFGRVIELLAAVITSPTTVGHVKREAIMKLWGINTPSPADAFVDALGDPIESVQLTAAAALLRIGDLRSLKIAEDALLNRSVAAPELLHNLNVAIRDGVSDMAAVSTLSRLLERGSSDTRTAAATALSRTHSESAVRPLVSALDDSEKEVRYNAAVGLAELTGTPEWRPTPIAFFQNEKRYIQYWKEWARTR
jgi:hypothetical protein